MPSPKSVSAATTTSFRFNFNASSRCIASPPLHCRTTTNNSLATRSRAGPGYLPLFSPNLASQKLASFSAIPSPASVIVLRFNPSHSSITGDFDHKPPDDRTLKLGNTIRILHERLPTLLHSPLPQEILSPTITLRLFPSTHPHLPTVSGRIPYVAALWTSPVAWGRLPVVGNVKLTILTERLVKHGGSGNERLIVKWKTCGRDDTQLDTNKGGGVTTATRSTDTAHWTRILPSMTGRNRAFTGLFLFEFDDAGRISSHTIEHAEEGGNWLRTTSAVISVTDWLLGRAWARQEEGKLALGCSEASEGPHKMNTQG